MENLYDRLAKQYDFCLLYTSLQAAGIRLEDARYIDLYADYTRLLDQGENCLLYTSRCV